MGGVGVGLAELWCTCAAPVAAAQMERRGHFVMISGTSHGWNKVETLCRASVSFCPLMLFC